MQFHTIRAKTVAQARKKVRDLLGAEAVVISISESDNEVQIQCAIEETHNAKAEAYGPIPVAQLEEIVTALRWHAASVEVTERLLTALETLPPANTPMLSLARALDELFMFNEGVPLASRSGTTALLGPPGQGKTSMIVKLALAAKLEGMEVAILAADTLRLCSDLQLQAYGEKMACDVFVLPEVGRMKEAVAALQNYQKVFIDLPGTNPNRPQDLRVLTQLMAEIPSADVVLVLSALLAHERTVSMGHLFKPFAPKWLLMTMQDIDPQMGPILDCAFHHSIAVAGFSPRAEIAEGLEDFTPMTLARMILDCPRAEEEAGTLKPPRAKPPTAEAPPLVAPPVAVPPPPPVAVAESVPQVPPVPVAESSRQMLGPRAAMRVIASGKGGVGKTFFASTLAIELARAKRKVLVFDGDLGMTNIDIQLGLHIQHDLAKVLKEGTPLSSVITRFEEGGFDLIAGRSTSSSFASLPPGDIAKLSSQLTDLSKQYDDILIDLGAGVDRTVQMFAHAADQLIVVTNEEPTSLSDAYALIKLLHRRRPMLPVHVILNSVIEATRAKQTRRALEETCKNFLGFSPVFAGSIPHDPEVNNSVRKQEALAIRLPGSPSVEAIRKISSHLLKTPVVPMVGVDDN